LRTLPAEEAQVDWAHFGKLTIGQATRPLVAFVMGLRFSRHLFLRFFPSAAMPSFPRGHVEAFAFFGGVPRVLLYDNLERAASTALSTAAITSCPTVATCCVSSPSAAATSATRPPTSRAFLAGTSAIAADNLLFGSFGSDAGPASSAASAVSCREPIHEEGGGGAEPEDRNDRWRASIRGSRPKTTRRPITLASSASIMAAPFTRGAGQLVDGIAGARRFRQTASA
jgi:hypothetical protein